MAGQEGEPRQRLFCRPRARPAHGRPRTATGSDVDAWAKATGASKAQRPGLRRLRVEAEVSHSRFRERMRADKAAVQRDYTWFTERSQSSATWTRPYPGLPSGTGV